MEPAGGTSSDPAQRLLWQHGCRAGSWGAGRCEGAHTRRSAPFLPLPRPCPAPEGPGSSAGLPSSSSSSSSSSSCCCCIRRTGQVTCAPAEPQVRPASALLLAVWRSTARVDALQKTATHLRCVLGTDLSSEDFMKKLDTNSRTGASQSTPRLKSTKYFYYRNILFLQTLEAPWVSYIPAKQKPNGIVPSINTAKIHKLKTFLLGSCDSASSK
ncbi:uncharacterized protein LOC131378604 [Hirundo rustica]|uniref:uncharacterized protein LOC131378604 n=1 Tax=Hirundo rustica TaxID=43150 RepID=UPI002673F454|nr:uncharacterized protein LOC131378604 [Hirundo rustica]